ncbi:hypothetical protein [Nonomuraea guangzhouensis]|uniref:Uncharacterized protein n=1 Tax=Nonomuraea guangzhouensis TaxID=1291555 RepID=A0ABW4GUT5_9ACTN|nr:hypothetical protein [Nonomuraea guangzhouensis]
MRIDALCLASDTDVAGPSVDFTRLPYVDGVTGRDVGADLPYLGEILLPAPFEDQNFRLKRGVHLHWALPDALTRHVQSEQEGTRAPVVPNRWLVTRFRGGTVEEQWVVESDTLSDDNLAGVAYPVPSAAGRPYRYLGRKVALGLWDPSRDRPDRLPELTVSGYGEPAFAAFYPNCHSVFGFHDPDPGDLAGLAYDVIGWYGDAGQDELARTLETAPETDSWQDVIEEQLGWTAEGDAGRPGSMVCFGRLVFAPAETTVNPLLADAESGVCVGNTATEALAAHLGSVIPGATPDELENLLEALTYADELESAALDLSIGLAESRHSTSFSRLPGGTLWSIRREDETGPSVTAEQKQNRDRLTPPAALDDLLTTLNQAQSDYDQAWRTITGLRRRLFWDWYRYMLCAYPPEGGPDDYPDPDEVAFFLARGMAELDRLAGQAGIHPPQGEGDTLAHRLAAARAAVDTALAALNQSIGARARTAYVPQQVPAPAYYLPNEPVVLLTGSAATPSDRYGQDGAQDPDGLLTCWTLSEPAGRPDTAAAVTVLRDRVAALVTSLSLPNPAVRTWRHAPWHPVLLQWEAEFFPTSAGNNLGTGHRDYDRDFVVANYELPPADVELRMRPGRNVPDKGANVYSGTTILSPSARPVMSSRILRYLAGNMLTDYNAPRAAAGLPQVEPDVFRADPGEVLDWYDANGGDDRLKRLAAAYRHLDVHEADNLAQSLGGFNDALLMLRVARQLPVDDPLGFPASREFIAQVAARVGDENRHAPQPLTDFNPIRAGALRVRQLRILDNFGNGHDIDLSRFHTTTGLRVADHPDWVALPPRLAQPARIRLTFLDAGHDTRPSTGLPGNTPVCGWIVPDNLDGGLLVHTSQGVLLGTLYAAADPVSPSWAYWESASGGAVTDIENPHLRAVVERLRAGGAAGVEGVRTLIDEALASIDPDGHTQHPGRAMFTGRPIAVVRAEVALEAMEPPAVHQDWNVFRQDMTRAARETNGFPRVRYSVRIGEHDRLGDGTLGYWLEDLSGALEPDFHDVQGESEPSLTVAADLPPRRLTLLADPRGSIHATSGVLPTESVRLAVEHYQDAMANLEAGFLTAPLLTDDDSVAVPLPAEPGSVWSWREHDPAGWVETAHPPQPAERFPAGLTFREGWLALRTLPTGTVPSESLPVEQGNT